MGANIRISLVHKQAAELLQQSFAILQELEHRFNANSPNSELMQINHQAGIKPVLVHPDLFELISLGVKNSLAPQSHLNIAIGPLVDLWRIGFFDARVPSEQEINKVLPLINPQYIHLDCQQRTVFLEKRGMKIDLGCLAKGYSADKVANFLKQQGVASALIDLGGNILTIGGKQNPNPAPWQIGIQDPVKPRGNHLLTLPIVSKSLVTSGIYVRYLETGDNDYHHILDSQTGYPIQTDLVSLTILSDKSVDGEIWTTRLFGEASHSILWQIEQRQDLEAILVFKDGRVVSTTGLQL